MGFSLAVMLGWLITIVVHLNTLRRNALQSSKDTLIKDIYELIDSYDKETQTIEELLFDHKISRVDRRISELNSIFNGRLLAVSDEQIERLITLELEDLKEHQLKSVCFEAVEYIDQVYHEKVLKLSSFFYINRYEIVGVFCSSVSIYAFFESISWLYS